MDESKKITDTEDKKLLRHANIYVSKNDQYEENKSTGYSFLAVGIVIPVLVVLCCVHVLPLPLTFDSQPVMTAALLIMAVIFLVIGFLSLKKAKTCLESVSEEKETEDTLTEWFSKNYTAAVIDEAIGAAEGERKEVLALSRMDFIKNALLEKNPQLPDNHADSLCETIYQKLYED